MKTKKCPSIDLSNISGELASSLNHSALGRELLCIFSTRNLSPLFQPIVDIKNRKVFAYEALIRGPENSPLHSPLDLFHVAEEYNCLFEMDWLARQIAIEKYQQYDTSEYLFINVTVNALMQDGHKSGVTLDCLKALGVNLEQVVIEITELQPVEDFSLFVKSVNHYREMGFKVAIDDLGSGYNGLRIWSEIKPDFVKIDKHFVTGIVDDADKRRFMKTICALAKDLNTKIVAEGVEDEATLKIIENLGVDYVQGYLFKKPQPFPTRSLDYQWPVKVKAGIVKLEQTAESIVLPCDSFHPDRDVRVVTDYLLKETQVDFIPIVDNKKIIGMVWRRDLMDLLARRFGRDLYHKKTIATIMDDAPLVVDVDMPLVELSRLITDYKGNHKGDAFIISDKGEFRGCGRFMDLLRVITDLKMESAQYANPLSGLPGNMPIQNTIQNYLNQKLDFIVIYVDVDHFKAYNDYYSFDQGDDVIRAISDILQTHTQSEVDFVGHIGGDDFIIVSPRVDDYQAICNGILADFRQKIEPFYLPEDIAQKGIQCIDREGKPTFYPMMTLSLGVLLVSDGAYSHQQQLASFATKAKKKAKSQGGDSFAVIDSSHSD